LATTPAQRWQQGQLNAGNDASTIWARMPALHQKNAIAASARPLKAKLPWNNAGYRDKATGNNNECDNDASPVTCRDCVMTGQTPVCDAGSNMGVTRVTTPA
jgi:hypothetical protein